MNFDGMKVIFDENKIQFGDEVVRLRPRAMDIFYILYEKNGEVMSRSRLISKVWGATEEPLCIDNTLSVQINSINGNLRPFGYCVINIRGRGFALRTLAEKLPSIPETKCKIGQEELTVSEWSKKYAISMSIIKQRVDRGWPLEKSVTTPPIKKRARR